MTQPKENIQTVPVNQEAAAAAPATLPSATPERTTPPLLPLEKDLGGHNLRRLAIDPK